MKSYQVTMEVKPPVEATAQEVEDWVKYCVGDVASISPDNPLSFYDLDADDVLVW